ncbi:hypothetical protein GCM10010327_48900 [Streptomyces nitrosporeus]|nr:hypothetical protein GCM10010327_48900 [Streptomyces nitrosporeus]
MGRGGAPEQVLVDGHAPSVPAPRTTTKTTRPHPPRGPPRAPPRPLRACHGPGPHPRGDRARDGVRAGAYLIRVPVERRFAQASVTRAAMPASADLPQLRGS